MLPVCHITTFFVSEFLALRRLPLQLLFFSVPANVSSLRSLIRSDLPPWFFLKFLLFCFWVSYSVFSLTWNYSCVSFIMDDKSLTAKGFGVAYLFSTMTSSIMFFIFQALSKFGPIYQQSLNI